MTVTPPSYGWRGQDEWSAEEDLEYQLSRIDQEGARYYLVDYTNHYSPREGIQYRLDAVREWAETREDELNQAVRDAEKELESLDEQVWLRLEIALREFADEEGITFPQQALTGY